MPQHLSDGISLKICEFCGEFSSFVVLIGCYNYTKKELEKFASCWKCFKHPFPFKTGVRMDVKEITIDKELYINWLNDETQSVQSMDLETVTKRIIELETRSAELKARSGVLYKKRAELLGADFKANRDALINPQFKLNLNFDPRRRVKTESEGKSKQSKEERSKSTLTAAGIDLDALKRNIAAAKLKQALAESDKGTEK